MTNTLKANCVTFIPNWTLLISVLILIVSAWIFVTTLPHVKASDTVDQDGTTKSEACQLCGCDS